MKINHSITTILCVTLPLLGFSQNNNDGNLLGNLMLINYYNNEAPQQVQVNQVANTDQVLQGNRNNPQGRQHIGRSNVNKSRRVNPVEQKQVQVQVKVSNKGNNPIAQVRIKPQPIAQIQLQQASINFGNNIQAEQMKVPKEKMHMESSHSNAGRVSAPQEKRLGVPLKYRIKYMRIGGGSKSFKSKKRKGSSLKASRKTNKFVKCFQARS